MNKILLKICFRLHLAVMAAVVGIVLLTAYEPGCRRLLAAVTRENGLFETGSVLVLLCIGGYGFFVASGRDSESMRRSERILAAGLGGLAVLAALEEISWGQHWFGFQTFSFFSDYNRQGETNLHNLIPAHVFGFLTNAAFYAWFLYLPMFRRFYRSRSRNASGKGKNGEILPGVHNMLMILFGFTLQAYFRIETLADTIALLAAFGGVGVIIFFQDSDQKRAHTLHYICVGLAMLVFMLHYRLFRYANLQYEIREFVFACGVLYGCIQWADRSSGGEDRHASRTASAKKESE